MMTASNHRVTRKSAVPLGIIAVIFVALACLASGAAVGLLATRPSDLTAHSLKHMAYRSDWPRRGVATLVNGEYREKYAPDSSSELVVRLGQSALADLNGDTRGDAAVILMIDPGGSGTFYELAAVINDHGTPRHVASVFLGDRIIVKALSVAAGRITVEITVHGPMDPMSRPTHQVTTHYILRNHTLEPVAGAGP